MQCVWEGDIRWIIDTLKFLAILDNIKFWVVHHFRPWVSSCLDQWRLRNNLEGMSTGTIEYVDHRDQLMIKCINTFEPDDCDIQGSDEDNRSQNSEDYQEHSEESVDSEDEDTDEEYEEDGTQDSFGLPYDNEEYIPPSTPSRPMPKQKTNTGSSQPKNKYVLAIRSKRKSESVARTF